MQRAFKQIRCTTSPGRGDTSVKLECPELGKDQFTILSMRKYLVEQPLIFDRRSDEAHSIGTNIFDTPITSLLPAYEDVEFELGLGTLTIIMQANCSPFTCIGRMDRFRRLPKPICLILQISSDVEMICWW